MTIYKVKEPVRIASVQASRRMRKGTIRWLWLVQGGNAGDWYDNITNVQLASSAYSNSTVNAAVVMGPWDGVTITTIS